MESIRDAIPNILSFLEGKDFGNLMKSSRIFHMESQEQVFKRYVNNHKNIWETTPIGDRCIYPKTKVLDDSYADLYCTRKAVGKLDMCSHHRHGARLDKGLNENLKPFYSTGKVSMDDMIYAVPKIQEAVDKKREISYRKYVIDYVTKFGHMLVSEKQVRLWLEELSLERPFTIKINSEKD